ncbi:MAG: hypothetical protein EXQ55_07050 [Acidobacteria bacterium]|nr:hypothetical protein [Acidobacteriota bacterium]
MFDDARWGDDPRDHDDGSRDLSRDTVRLDRDTSVVTLTKEGRDLLEPRQRDTDSPERQAFHYGVQKPRELKQHAQVYRAYLEEAERLRDEGANIHRVIVENELKAE